MYSPDVEAIGANDSSATKRITLSSYFNNAHCGPGTVAFMVLLAVSFNSVSLFQLMVGVTFLGQCPLEPMIPVYLIGWGGANIFLFCLRSLCKILWKDGRLPKWLKAILGILMTCNIIWFLFGSYFVFHIYDPKINTDPRLGPYCATMVYYCGLTSQLIVYSLVLLFISLPLVCWYLLMLMMTNNKVCEVGSWLGEDKDAVRPVNVIIRYGNDANSPAAAPRQPSARSSQAQSRVASAGQAVREKSAKLAERLAAFKLEQLDPKQLKQSDGQLRPLKIRHERPG